MTTKSRKIEVLRPGTFTPMNGAPVTFSADDLKAIAAAYDGATAPVPAVVGHPRTDDPAYGWASSFSWDEANQRLLAELGELAPTFAEAVADGRYKRISLSLFPPAASNNPKPGSWYPKHIGFLGAAAPAVPGLKPVAFAGDGAGAVTFEFADAAISRDVGGLFRSMREWMIEKFGSEEADKALPGWTIGWIEDADDRAAPQITPGFASPQPKPETSMTKPDAARETDLAEREKKLAARERAATHADNVSFAEKMIGERRLLPVLKDKLIGLLDGLTPTGGAVLEVSFAEGAETKTASALDLVKGLISAQPPVVSLGAADLGKDVPAVEFAMPSGMTADPVSADLHARAVAWQAAHPGTDYMAAVAAVGN